MKKSPKLSSRAHVLASKFIVEEIKTRKYPRKQAIAIGLSRAREAGKHDRIGRIVQKYL